MGVQINQLQISHHLCSEALTIVHIPIKLLLLEIDLALTKGFAIIVVFGSKKALLLVLA